MVLTKEVEIKWNGSNKRHFISRGYSFTKINSVFKVKIEDLTKSSTAIVKVKCDNVNCDHSKTIIWRDYLRLVKEDNKYYCRDCVRELFLGENIRLSKLKNGKSFEQWCIENNRQDVLDRWDYELNNCKPSETTFRNAKKYYFKCPKGIHKSELKYIANFTNTFYGISCNQCNSFAQWGIDNIGEDFLEKYWDYEKNKVSPWEIDKGSSSKKVWIKCQEKNYHGSYKTYCNTFINNFRCPYCSNKGGKIHHLDSLGSLYHQVLNIWSDKNDKSPYNYSPHSKKEVYWKCPEGKHKDYKRRILDSNRYNFRFPECKYSKGEERISNYLIKKEFIKISQQEFNQLIDQYKCNKNYFIPQMKFNGLVRLKGGLLSYDFYLPKYNLLIEYQGEQHEKYIPGLHKSIKDFEKQVKHDRRKREYAQNNNINLLEIWYWDFDNTEEILNTIVKRGL